MQNQDIRAIFRKPVRTPTEAEIEDEFGETGRMVTPPKIFTALHGMQTRSSDGNSLHLSVRLSVCLSLVYCDKTVERCVQIYIPYERTFSLVFREEEWLLGATIVPEIWGQPAPVGAKSPI